MGTATPSGAGRTGRTLITTFLLPLMSVFHFSDNSKIKEGKICEIQPKST
jgi:hypothetical protein